MGVESDNDFIAGALAGVRFVNGAFLFGVELDVGLGKRDFAISKSTSCLDTVCESDWNAHLRGMVGVVHNDWTLFFAAGLAATEIERSSGSHPTEFGVSWGGGVQYAANHDWDVRVEFLQDRYDELIGGFYTTEEWTDDTVRASAIYKF